MVITSGVKWAESDQPDSYLINHTCLVLDLGHAHIKYGLSSIELPDIIYRHNPHMQTYVGHVHMGCA